MAASLQLLGERWTLLAIRELTYGVHRFDQIARFTGASRDILADRLRELEEAGVVERRQYSEHPPRFEYHLTAAGQELRPVLLSLAEWGSRWAQEPPTATFAHDCGHALEIDQVCHHCGEPVTPAARESATECQPGDLVTLDHLRRTASSQEIFQLAAPLARGSVVHFAEGRVLSRHQGGPT